VAVAPPRLIPQPEALKIEGGDPFVLTDSVGIVADGSNADVAKVAMHLATILRAASGFSLPIASTSASSRTIALRLSPDASLGAEGYQLTVRRDSVRVTANAPAGLFHGVQTLRQLFPWQIESHMILSRAAWRVPAVTITDRPRYAWRGAMLDVSRHFFTQDEVYQYIDLLALYKLNVLHLHLADDQGFRIEIKSRPNLTAMASSTQVGGGPGGFYTQDQYAEIVRYAADRFITIVPEIDMPGHTNAALIGYPEASCSRRAPAVYTGTEVGWSTFCANKEETYALVDDIVREVAAITPGQYFHMGGDENPILSKEDYRKFVERTQEIVARHGKLMIGWEEIAQAKLLPTSIAQVWRSDSALAATQFGGAKLLMSPASRTYFDMKYDDNTELGLKWAGLVEVRTAYDWDPATFFKGVLESNIAGVEAPIWSETVRNITAVEYLALPRLPALAEVGWTPQALRSWDSFRDRVAAHAPRWNLLGLNYYRSPQISW
jgi:hexosaminidase